MAGESIQFDKYSAMGNDSADYEACYEFSRECTYQGSHCHDFYELYLHLGGGRYYGIDNVIYELQPNQLFIIPPFCIHGQVIQQRLTDYKRAFLYITVETLRRIGCGQIDLDKYFRSVTESGRNQFCVKERDASKYIELVTQLKERQQKNTALDKFQSYSLLMSLLSLTCGIIEESEATTGVSTPNEIMQKVLTYVNKHYMQPIRVSDIARQFGISISYLSHEFRKYTNRSVYSYIIYRRVMLAKKLMQHEASLSVVAEQCGFPDYSSFLRMFVKVAGMPPSHYKKIICGKNNAD